ncbi:MULTISPECIES: putative Ig domain-containing protein [Micromonospora]|uniref:Uncharacterized protein n=1 Tax=Micromonospora haikouensis TaxID=686309 RepID=A0A0D0WRK4_9ACTN|nr:putative Ig domain-containing protein [Micromonospora haikouensis]KIR61354.1 hypothetical protein TK50_27180 [Micromonospora haikouensis]
MYTPPAQATTVADLLTEHVVQINESVGAAGFAHPGIGLSAADLRSTQAQIRAGTEPWKSYFEAMAATTAAATTYRSANSKSAAVPDQPADNTFTQVGMRYRENTDGVAALTQALMWVTTGNEVYRRNAIQVVRVWSRMDPTKYAYFADAHIHTGLPLQQILTAAEILRATEPVADDTPGTYNGYDVTWHESDAQNLLTNFANPVLTVFSPGNDRWMNQHLFGLFGRIATAIFADDAAGYAKGVEWLTVNSTFDEYWNGSLAAQAPLIKAGDPANPYGRDFVQLREMGRDQAHAECNVVNFASLGKLLEVQGTKIDPVAGTVSTDSDAVSFYDFLDRRLLAAADAFAGYMLGAPTPWIDETGSGGFLSQAYRGRQFSPLTELYYIYKGRGVDVDRVAPYLAKLHAVEDGPQFWYGTTVSNFWNYGVIPGNAGYWYAFPAELAGTAPAALPADASLPFAKYSLQLDGRTRIVTEGGQSFARARVDEKGTISALSRQMWSAGGRTGVLLRSDGPTTLQVLDKEPASKRNPKEIAARVLSTIEVPDTEGTWRYIAYPSAGSNVGYYRLTGKRGTTVDLDKVILTGAKDLTQPAFPQQRAQQYLLLHKPSVIDLSATDPGGSVTYRAYGLPKGAVLDPATGALTWTPARRPGRYPVQVVADDGQSVTARTFEMVVSADRARMIKAAVADGTSDSAVYTSPTKATYDAALATARSVAATGTDEEFATAFAALLEAISALQLLNPTLSDGSLAYAPLVKSSVIDATTVGYLTDDDQSTFSGDLRVGAVVLDFGTRYRVTPEQFTFQARYNFGNRMQGTNVYGSDDAVTWTLLSASATVETNDYQTVAVRDDQKGKAYRFLKLQVDQPGVPTDPAYPGIWSFAEFHVFGQRQEVPGALSTVSIASTGALAGRISAGAPVTLKFSGPEAISRVAVTIGGQPVTPASEDGLTWTATTTLGDVTGSGILPFTIDYITAGGVTAPSITASTDFTALFASDDRNQVNLATGGTLVTGTGTADTANATHAARLFDSSVTTFSDVAPVNGAAALTWDLGAGKTITLDRADVLVRQDNNGLTRQVDQALEGSNDLSTWTRLTGTTGKSLSWQSLPATGHGQYRYLRIRNGNYLNIAELRVFGTVQ